jgi:hypothetical protein
LKSCRNSLKSSKKEGAVTFNFQNKIKPNSNNNTNGDCHVKSIIQNDQYESTLVIGQMLEEREIKQFDGEEVEEGIQQSRSETSIIYGGLKHDPFKLETNILESDIIKNIECNNDYHNGGDHVYNEEEMDKETREANE